MRLLGIPTISDRIAQMVICINFEPNSSINDRLKQVIVEMLGEVKK